MKKLLLGIRKEDEGRLFETRVPLTPKQVYEILSVSSDNIEILIQPSNGRGYRFERCFSDDEFRRAGAQVEDEIAGCAAIFGIKEVPIRDLEPDKTYIFFSHTFKGQGHNMMMLKRLLALGCTLVDYEMIVDDISDNEFSEMQRAAEQRTAPASLVERTVHFGRFAGVSGVINSLWALGKRLSLEGYVNNPFSRLEKAIDYRVEGEAFGNYEIAVKAIQSAGERLMIEGLPEPVRPLVIGILGKGNTAKGAREILKLLPHHNIDDPFRLTSLEISPDAAKHQIYLVDFGREHTREPVFQSLLPSLTMVINCIKWQRDEPRLITRDAIKRIYSPRAAMPRLRVIGDITCDPGGSLEFSRETFSDDPVYTYDPWKDNPALAWENEAQRVQSFAESCRMGIGLDGPVVMAVTNLPCEFPKDASIAFGEMLYPYVLDLVRVATEGVFDRVPISRPVRRAVIAHKGQLMPDYSYLEDKLSPKNVLILGAGRVSPELVRHLAGLNCRLRVLDQDHEAACRLIQTLDPALATADRRDFNPTTPPEDLYNEFCKADIVISLLPPSHHFAIAQACIEARAPLLTASYAGAIRDLHARARSVGITLLTEMGLDPGIDHVSALRMIRESKELEERLESFQSYCGGLPAPEFSQNALRYKFSWRVRGVLDALQQEGRYLDQDKEVCIPPLTELEPLALPVFTEPFEVFANRDSLAYVDKYGARGSHRFLRATLRYPGWGAFWRAIRDLGWLATTTTRKLPMSPREISAELGLPESHKLVDRISWLLARIRPGACPLESLEAALVEIPAAWYAEGECDLVVMHHRLTTCSTKGERLRRTATMVLRGSGKAEGISAMSLSTGGMLAIGAQLILEGRIKESGVLDPTNENVAALTWPELMTKGITFVETKESAEA